MSHIYNLFITAKNILVLSLERIHTLHFPSSRKGGAVDRYGEKLRLFKDVKIILSTLEEQGIPIAAASR